MGQKELLRNSFYQKFNIINTNITNFYLTGFFPHLNCDFIKYCIKIYKPRIAVTDGENKRLHSLWLVKQSKAIPLEAWTGPKGSERLRLPYFKKIGT
jgi:hypothetical protein